MKQKKIKDPRRIVILKAIVNNTKLDRLAKSFETCWCEDDELEIINYKKNCRAKEEFN